MFEDSALDSNELRLHLFVFVFSKFIQYLVIYFVLHKSINTAVKSAGSHLESWNPVTSAIEPLPKCGDPLPKSEFTFFYSERMTHFSMSWLRSFRLVFEGLRMRTVLARDLNLQ